MLKPQFDQLIQEEMQSIEKIMARCEALYICGYDNGTNEKNKGQHVIACVLYNAKKEGIYINWFAVTKEVCNEKRFGKFASNLPF